MLVLVIYMTALLPSTWASAILPDQSSSISYNQNRRTDATEGLSYHSAEDEVVRNRRLSADEIFLSGLRYPGIFGEPDSAGSMNIFATAYGNKNLAARDKGTAPSSSSTDQKQAQTIPEREVGHVFTIPEFPVIDSKALALSNAGADNRELFRSLYETHPDVLGIINPNTKSLPLNVIGLPEKYRVPHPNGHANGFPPKEYTTNANLPGPVVDVGVRKGSGWVDDDQKFHRLYAYHPDTQGFVNPSKDGPLNVIGLPPEYVFQHPNGNVNGFPPKTVSSNAFLPGPVVDVILEEPRIPGRQPAHARLSAHPPTDEGAHAGPSYASAASRNDGPAALTQTIAQSDSVGLQQVGQKNESAEDPHLARTRAINSGSRYRFRNQSPTNGKQAERSRARPQQQKQQQQRNNTREKTKNDSETRPPGGRLPARPLAIYSQGPVRYIDPQNIRPIKVASQNGGPPMGYHLSDFEKALLNALINFNQNQQHRAPNGIENADAKSKTKAANGPAPPRENKDDGQRPTSMPRIPEDSSYHHEKPYHTAGLQQRPKNNVQKQPETIGQRPSEEPPVQPNGQRYWERPNENNHPGISTPMNQHEGANAYPLPDHPTPSEHHPFGPSASPPPFFHSDTISELPFREAPEGMPQPPPHQVPDLRPSSPSGSVPEDALMQPFSQLDGSSPRPSGELHRYKTRERKINRIKYGGGAMPPSSTPSRLKDMAYGILQSGLQRHQRREMDPNGRPNEAGYRYSPDLQEHDVPMADATTSHEDVVYARDRYGASNRGHPKVPYGNGAPHHHGHRPYHHHHYTRPVKHDYDDAKDDDGKDDNDDIRHAKYRPHGNVGYGGYSSYGEGGYGYNNPGYGYNNPGYGYNNPGYGYNPGYGGTTISYLRPKSGGLLSQLLPRLIEIGANLGLTKEVVLNRPTYSYKPYGGYQLESPPGVTLRLTLKNLLDKKIIF